MKERLISLLRGEFAIIADSDFQQVQQHRWYLNNGYPVARIAKRLICLHVFLLGRAPDGHHIDHINRNKLDNRRSNLRIVTAAENLRNRRSYKGSENPFYGKTHSAEFSRRNAERCGIPVVQLQKDGSLVCHWPSAMEVQRQLGISNANITEVVNGNRKSAGGFLWRRP